MSAQHWGEVLAMSWMVRYQQECLLIFTNLWDAFSFSSMVNVLINLCYNWSQMKWQITPMATFIMVLLALSPCLFKTWRNPRPRLIARSVAYAYTCGFLFGWHVHEKASLHFVIPLTIVAVESLEDAKHYFVLSIGMVLLVSVISWLIIELVQILHLIEPASWSGSCLVLCYPFVP